MQTIDIRPYVRLAKASIALQYRLVRESRLACDAEDRVRYGYRLRQVLTFAQRLAESELPG